MSPNEILFNKNNSVRIVDMEGIGADPALGLIVLGSELTEAGCVGVGSAPHSTQDTSKQDLGSNNKYVQLRLPTRNKPIDRHR